MNKEKILSNKTKALGFFIAIGLLFLVGYFISVFLDSSDDIKAAIMSAAIAIATVIYAQYKTRKRDIESRLFETKSQAYKTFIDLYFDDIFLKIAKGQTVDWESTEFLEKLFKTKKEFFVWASAETLNSFSLIGTNTNQSEIFKQINNLFKNIRKDLGHIDTNLSENFYVKYVVKSEEWDNIDKIIKGENK